MTIKRFVNRINKADISILSLPDKCSPSVLSGMSADAFLHFSDKSDIAWSFVSFMGKLLSFQP